MYHNQDGSSIFGTKIESHNLRNFWKIEILDTIWDFLTVCLLQGTIWYSLFKYQPVLEIAQRLNYTAMGVGNHDFDDGKDGLIPFVEEVGFPVLASNLNLTLLPDLAKVLPKSQIVNVGGYQVGIIGYITSDR